MGRSGCVCPACRGSAWVGLRSLALVPGPLACVCGRRAGRVDQRCVARGGPTHGSVGAGRGATWTTRWQRSVERPTAAAAGGTLYRCALRGGALRWHPACACGCGGRRRPLRRLGASRLVDAGGIRRVALPPRGPACGAPDRRRRRAYDCRRRRRPTRVGDGDVARRTAAAGVGVGLTPTAVGQPAPPPFAWGAGAVHAATALGAGSDWAVGRLGVGGGSVWPAFGASATAAGRPRAH